MKQYQRDCCPYEAVVIGVSAGGLSALDSVLPSLHQAFCLPILIVQHVSPAYESYLPVHFDARCHMKATEAEDKEPITAGTIYFAPPNYHMLVEEDKSIALSTDIKVNFSRPSIDVLFETAATVYRQKLIGIILTGASSDGAKGLHRIHRLGGTTIAQDPSVAEAPTMPKSAIKATVVDHVLSLAGIAAFLNNICHTQ